MLSLAASVLWKQLQRKRNATAARLDLIGIRTGLLGASFCTSCSKVISSLNRNHTIAILSAKQTSVLLIRKLFVLIKLLVN